MERVASSARTTRKHFPQWSEAVRELLLLQTLKYVFPTVQDLVFHIDYTEMVVERCDSVADRPGDITPEGVFDGVRPLLKLLHQTYHVAHLSISPETIGRTHRGDVKLLNTTTTQKLGTRVTTVQEMKGGFVAADLMCEDALVEERFDWYALAATVVWMKAGVVPFTSVSDPRYHRLRAIGVHAPCLSSLALFMGLPDLPPMPFLALLLLGIARRDAPSLT